MKQLQERLHYMGKGVYFVIFFLIIFWGCATKDAVKGVSDEEVLRERVMTYWGHKINQDFDKSYGYEDPLFRKSVKMVNYIKSFNNVKASWSGAGIENLKIENDSAIVDMKLKVQIMASPSKNIEQNVLLKEKWVKVDGIWYHIQQKSRDWQGSDK